MALTQWWQWVGIGIALYLFCMFLFVLWMVIEYPVKGQEHFSLLMWIGMVLPYSILLFSLTFPLWIVFFLYTSIHSIQEKVIRHIYSHKKGKTIQ